MKLEKLHFSVHDDEECSCGALVALEAGKDIPFEVKRIFYIYGVDYHQKRGAHAHRTSWQLLVCVHGSCEIILGDGRETERILLDAPNKGVVQKPLIWGEMEHFSKDAVLMVLSDSLYDPDEYIRDYKEFLELCGVSS
jgi:dTDP-4-dehydrorhamnose 3,5-epimerase-like enzyme